MTSILILIVLCSQTFTLNYHEVYHTIRCLKSFDFMCLPLLINDLNCCLNSYSLCLEGHIKGVLILFVNDLIVLFNRIYLGVILGDLPIVELK